MIHGETGTMDAFDEGARGRSCAEHLVDATCSADVLGDQKPVQIPWRGLLSVIAAVTILNRHDSVEVGAIS